MIIHVQCSDHALLINTDHVVAARFDREGTIISAVETTKGPGLRLWLSNGPEQTFTGDQAIALYAVLQGLSRHLGPLPRDAYLARRLDQTTYEPNAERTP